MSLTYNGIAIEKVTFNGTNVEKLYHGATLVFEDFFTFNITLASNVAYYDLYNDLIGRGWDGMRKVKGTLTVNSGVLVHSGSTATGIYAMSIGGFPAGSDVTLVNHGEIRGMGGAGGSYAGAGGTGGRALYVSSALKIYNYGRIEAGGGGGGGAYVQGTYTYNQSTYWAYARSGGGGAAGIVAGGGGAASGGSWNSNGAGGGYYAGGAGGTADSGDQGGNTYGITGYGKGGKAIYGYTNYTWRMAAYGGVGGGPGAAGATGATYHSNVGNVSAAGYGGGAPGYYIVGAGHVTWLATGTRSGYAA